MATKIRLIFQRGSRVHKGGLAKNELLEQYHQHVGNPGHSRFTKDERYYDGKTGCWKIAYYIMLFEGLAEAVRGNGRTYQLIVIRERKRERNSRYKAALREFGVLHGLPRAERGERNAQRRPASGLNQAATRRR